MTRPRSRIASRACAFEAQDALAALHGGLPGSMLLLMSLIIKMARWPQMRLNGVIRELKRIELELLRRPT